MHTRKTETGNSYRPRIMPCPEKENLFISSCFSLTLNTPCPRLASPCFIEKSEYVTKEEKRGTPHSPTRSHIGSSREFLSLPRTEPGFTFTTKKRVRQSPTNSIQTLYNTPFVNMFPKAQSSLHVKEGQSETGVAPFPITSL